MQIKKNSLKCAEHEEAGYLQLKLTPITIDELLDFHCLLSKQASTADAFQRGYIQACASGYSSDFEPVRPSPDVQSHRSLVFLFLCAKCKFSFSDQYVPDSSGLLTLLPVCPQCGHSQWVEEIF